VPGSALTSSVPEQRQQRHLLSQLVSAMDLSPGCVAAATRTGLLVAALLTFTAQPPHV